MSCFQFRVLSIVCLLALYPGAAVQAQDITVAPDIVPQNNAGGQEPPPIIAPIVDTYVPPKPAATPSKIKKAPDAKMTPVPPSSPSVAAEKKAARDAEKDAMHRKYQGADRSAFSRDPVIDQRALGEERLLANTSADLALRGKKVVLTEKRTPQLGKKKIADIARDFSIPESQVPGRCEVVVNGIVMSTALQRGIALVGGRGESEYGGSLVRIDLQADALCKLDMQPPGKGAGFRRGDRYVHMLTVGSCRPTTVLSGRDVAAVVAYNPVLNSFSCEFDERPPPEEAPR